MELGLIYFWTATINNWQRLLLPDDQKEIIVNSLSYLSSQNLIDIFGFVIMPNHVHLIWRIKKKNGKEMPSGSFLKFTAHEFMKRISNEGLRNFRVTASNKAHEFWQRDPLAIELYDSKIAMQKLDYIHANPVSKAWSLVDDPIDYEYSSCQYYEEGVSRFDFLQHVGEEY